MNMFVARPSRVQCVAHSVVLSAVVWAALAQPAFADEVSVKNDSIVDGSTATLQLGFDPGESAAAWLTSPCNGDIVAVQVFWKSASGGAPPSLESSIHIFQAGTFPVPGPSLAFLEGPVMTDGVLNEFRYLDEEQTIPIEVPVTNGQVFVVSFKFDSNPSQANGGPTVVTDIGCQGGKNAIDAIGLGWVNSCSLGVSGDFMIRAVVDCPAATGACCLPNGTCNPSMSASQCTSAGGTFQGIDSICPPSCPILTGACCKPDGSCVGGVTQSVCQGTHLGTYQGHGSNCGTVNCPQPPQACCNPNNGFCSMLEPGACTNFNGVPQGAGTVCVGTSSNQCPRGACCLPSGQCAENKTPVECASMSGAYQGTGSTCAQANCPQPQGACCLTGGGCTVSGQSTCEGFGHTWMGSGTDCSDLNGNTIADACESCDPPDGNMSGDAVTDGRDVGYFVAALMAMSTDEDDLCHGDFVADGVILNDDIPGMVDRLLVNP